MSATIKLSIFRQVSGVRTPYILELDSSRNVLNEYVDSDALAAVLRDMQQPVVLSQADARKIDVLTEWFDPEKPNPLTGTDMLRDACHQKLRDAEAASCAPCELNAIKAEYRNLLEKAKLI